MIQDPRKSPVRHQNLLISWSCGSASPLQRITLKFVFMQIWWQSRCRSPSKKFIEIHSWLSEVHCKMSLYALFPDGKESWKMVQVPIKNPDCHQNLINSSQCHAPPSTKFHQNPFITSGDILYTRIDYTCQWKNFENRSQSCDRNMVAYLFH